MIKKRGDISIGQVLLIILAIVFMIVVYMMVKRGVFSVFK